MNYSLARDNAQPSYRVRRAELRMVRPENYRTRPCADDQSEAGGDDFLDEARRLCDLARRAPIIIGRRKHASMLPEKRPNSTRSR